MGWSLVQTATGVSSGVAASVPATFASNVTAGNLLVAKVGCQVASGAVSGPGTLSDLGGNVYGMGPSKTAGSSPGVGCSVWKTGLANSGPLTVTYVPTASGLLALEVSEYSFGIETGFALDGSNTASGTSGTSLSSGSFTTTQTDLIIGVAVSTAIQTWLAGSGFTSLLAASGSSTQLAFLSEDNIGASAGTLSATMSGSATSTWAVCGAAYLGFSATIVRSAPAGDALAASANALPANRLAVTAGGDAFASSGAFKAPATIAHTAAGDVLAGSGAFKTAATLAHTAAGDALTSSAGLRLAATLAHATAGDVLGATAKFTDLFHLSGITAGDSFASSAHFASHATLAHVTAGDVFAAGSHSTFTVLTAAPSGDHAALSGHLTGLTVVGATEHHDIPSIFALVSPRLQATEHRDVMAISATAGTPPSTTLAHTTAGDTFGGLAGFSFDTRFMIAPVERQDLFAAVAISPSAATIAPIAGNDAFSLVTFTANHATLGAVAAGDIFSAGKQAVAYNVYWDAGSGIINYGSAIDTTLGLTWTSGALAFPATYMFAVRAHWVLGGLEEQNLDCEVTITLSATGTDISNVPAAPLALRAFPTAGGGIKVEWFYPPTYGAKSPTGFNVYIGTGATPNYGVVAANVLYSSAIGSNLVTNIAGLTAGILYQVGVRAYNAVGTEQNTNTVSVTPITTGPLPVQSLAGVATSQG